MAAVRRSEVGADHHAKADYAVRAALELAASPDGEPVKGEQLAEAQEIPLQFLEHILLELKHARLIQARRGARGGYWLARDPAEITRRRRDPRRRGPAREHPRDGARGHSTTGPGRAASGRLGGGAREPPRACSRTSPSPTSAEASCRGRSRRSSTTPRPGSSASRGAARSAPHPRSARFARRDALPSRRRFRTKLVNKVSDCARITRAPPQIRSESGLGIDPRIIVFGFGIGVLVGMTGMGGASLMTPLLILVFGISPVTAIGTDIFYGAVTKTVGG